MKILNQLAILPATVLLTFCSAPKATDEDKEPVVVGEEVSYSADTLTMEGYMAFDSTASEKSPGILVVHEWWGHNDYARMRAEMLAELGYVALAVDMYGNGKQASHPEDAMAFTGEVFSSIDGAKARFESAMETLKAHPKVDASKIGAIGYCFGGTVVLSMANAGYDLDAVAAFHAGLGLPIWPDSGAVEAEIIILQGADDPFVPQEQISNYKNKLDSAGAEYEMIFYEDAVHAFTSKEADEKGKKFELPLAYNAKADSASWEEMKQLFNEVF